MTNNRSGDTAAEISNMLGTWRLLSAEGCESTFPVHMEFREFGVYATSDGVDIGAVWHGGDWELEGTALKLQAANDEMLRYELEAIGEGTLRLRGVDGCVIQYTREA